MNKNLTHEEMERLIRISGRIFGITSSVFGALLLLLFVLAESAELIGQQNIPIAGYCLVSGLIMIAGGIFLCIICKNVEKTNDDDKM